MTVAVEQIYGQDKQDIQAKLRKERTGPGHSFVLLCPDTQRYQRFVLYSVEPLVLSLSGGSTKIEITGG